MRLATIDVGTNTALLLIAEVRPGAPLRPVLEEERFIRLGEGVDRTGRVSKAAMERLRGALVDYRRTAERLGAEHVCVAATSASRDAANRDELIAFVRRETGLSYEILSGDEEAAWTFAGTASGVADLTGLAYVLDIGGGSTEVVLGEAPKPHGERPCLRYRRSLDVGAVRMAERLFAEQPPPPEAVAACRATVMEALEAAGVPVVDAPLIGGAGTVTALAFVRAGVAAWPALAPADRAIAAAEVRAWAERLLTLREEEVLALHPTAMRGRADVFPTGVLILDAVLRYLRRPAIRVSPRDLRFGLAMRAAG